MKRQGKRPAALKVLKPKMRVNASNLCATNGSRQNVDANSDEVLGTLIK